MGTANSFMVVRFTIGNGLIRDAVFFSYFLRDGSVVAEQVGAL